MGTESKVRLLVFGTDHKTEQITSFKRLRRAIPTGTGAWN